MCLSPCQSYPSLISEGKVGEYLSRGPSLRQAIPTNIRLGQKITDYALELITATKGSIIQTALHDKKRGCLTKP